MAKSSSSTKRTGSSGGTRGSTSEGNKGKPSGGNKGKPKEDALERTMRKYKEADELTAKELKTGVNDFHRTGHMFNLAGGGLLRRTEIEGYAEAVKKAKGKPHEQALRGLVNYNIENRDKQEARSQELRRRSFDRSLSAKERSKARRLEIRLESRIRKRRDMLSSYLNYY